MSTPQTPTTLGRLELSPRGTARDEQLVSLERAFRHRGGSAAFVVGPDDLASHLPSGPMQASPAPGGRPFCLVLGDGAPYLLGPGGATLRGKHPLFEEAERVAKRARGRTMIGGDLCIDVHGSSPSPRAVDALLEGDTSLESALCFVASDLLLGGDDRASMPLGVFTDRLAVIRRMLAGQTLLRPLHVEVASGLTAAQSLYREWVAEGHARAMTLRSGSSLLEVRPPSTVHALVLGYTESHDDAAQVGALLLGLRRGDGQLQLIGHTHAVGPRETREKAMKALSGLATKTTFEHAATNGEFFAFVEPKIVVELKIAAVDARDGSGNVITAPVVTHTRGAYHRVGSMRSVHLTAPRLVHALSPKQARSTDVTLAPVAALVHLPDAADTAPLRVLANSVVLRREVWQRTSKEQRAVQKLVVIKTNKELVDPRYPAYVVHWTDYSPARKQPLVKEVYPEATRESVDAACAELIERNIKRGWEKIA